MAPGAAQIPECMICLNHYNLEDHLPMLLLPCGHGVCQMCVRGLTTCPVDRQPVQHSMINTPMRDMIDALRRNGMSAAVNGNDSHMSSPREPVGRDGRASVPSMLCSSHDGQLLEFFCPDDFMSCCTRCLVLEHHGHGKPRELTASALEQAMSSVKKDAVKQAMRRVSTGAEADAVLKRINTEADLLVKAIRLQQDSLVQKVMPHATFGLDPARREVALEKARSEREELKKVAEHVEAKFPPRDAAAAIELLQAYRSLKEKLRKHDACGRSPMEIGCLRYDSDQFEQLHAAISRGWAGFFPSFLDPRNGTSTPHHHATGSNGSLAGLSPLQVTHTSSTGSDHRRTSGAVGGSSGDLGGLWPYGSSPSTTIAPPQHRLSVSGGSSTSSVSSPFSLNPMPPPPPTSTSTATIGAHLTSSPGGLLSGGGGAIPSPSLTSTRPAGGLIGPTPTTPSRMPGLGLPVNPISPHHPHPTPSPLSISGSGSDNTHFNAASNSLSLGALNGHATAAGGDMNIATVADLPCAGPWYRGKISGLLHPLDGFVTVPLNDKDPPLSVYFNLMGGRVTTKNATGFDPGNLEIGREVWLELADNPDQVRAREEPTKRFVARSMKLGEPLRKPRMVRGVVTVVMHDGKDGFINVLMTDGKTEHKVYYSLAVNSRLQTINVDNSVDPTTLRVGTPLLVELMLNPEVEKQQDQLRRYVARAIRAVK